MILSSPGSSPSLTSSRAAYPAATPPPRITYCEALERISSTYLLLNDEHCKTGSSGAAWRVHNQLKYSIAHMSYNHIRHSGQLTGRAACLSRIVWLLLCVPQGVLSLARAAHRGRGYMLYCTMQWPAWAVSIRSGCTRIYEQASRGRYPKHWHHGINAACNKDYRLFVTGSRLSGS